MSLFETWRETAFKHADQETEANFWKEFCNTEKDIYDRILDKPYDAVEGQLKELAESFETSHVFFMGFLDGINDSLKTSLTLENLTEESRIRLEIDLEKLYYNMLAAKADYLYTLPQWDQILSPERRKEIEKEQKRSKTVVKGESIGRNEPCTCGSGKKFKKCCGK
ncbi:SEC-C metal-binding domain-containing protein [Geosporobacter ferrireducens]|uniref:Preprotein translocase subunit SecA n=1 Tax=Geosporobacter ferrireducens TaxID=1424294 RepID=A0A1D8GNA1_9FIRM|nr:SEC-C metal-binding domain-containing protein [Geosporobacter ferrireducens]AOT72398.1 preprotein translocase subunit SecA [Geosporobacter ferrireducens]MTI56346.1 SEC-C domain-containing protein [Geosporobacter ferrireducens]